jgi:mRNA interferase MazF
VERPVKGDVVVVPFPFSDLTTAKRRPAIVLATLRGDDVILCQVTSQAIRDEYAVPLAEGDFADGSLRRPSNARPNRIFTADTRLILYRVGRLMPVSIGELVEAVVRILRDEGS